MTLANAGFTPYLPVAPGLSLAINRLEQAPLKAAIKTLVAEARDRRDEVLTISRVQHAAARALGFGDGWGTLKACLEGPLADFRSSNGLLRQVDVLAVPFDCPFRLTYRQLADRLFESGRPALRHVFTGWNTDWWALLRLAAGIDGLKVVEIGHRALGLDAEGVDPATIDTHIPPANYVIVGASGYLLYQEVIGYFRNLIGDQLCRIDDPNAAVDPVATIYFQSGNDHSTEKVRLVTSGRMLQQLLAVFDRGWLEVIPFNDHLAFLKAPNGDYSFVFKGMRDRPSPCEGNGVATRGDQFEDWLYHDYKGWLDADLHVAETAFYHGGGTLATYPGELAVLQSYLETEERYSPDSRAAYPREEFRIAIVEGRELSLSSLVTIEQFEKFMRWDRDYASARSHIDGIESWEAANTGDPSLPAAVTWYDAVAYSRWYRRTQKLPVRLPTEAEILVLAGELVPKLLSSADLASAWKDVHQFSKPRGPETEELSSNSSQEEFRTIELLYRERNLPMARAESGLEFVRSVHFGEWLEPKGAAINTLFFCSQYDITLIGEIRVAASRGLYAPHSTGKYRGEKIGFRLVFDTKPSKVR